MKLFIWIEFSPDWSGGLAFAIAKDETDARKQIIKKYGHSPSDWGTLKVKPLTQRTCEAVGGGG